MNMSPSWEREVDDYLRRLRYALAPLPAEERSEIVREARSYFLDRMEGAGDPATAFLRAVEGLGAPEEYAGAFVDDYQITVAVSGGSGVAMLRQGLRMVERGAKALVGFALLLPLFAVAGALVLIAILKPVFPENVGAWFAPELGVMGIGFVTAETAASAPDLLGYWIIPVNLMLAVLLYRLGTALLKPFLRSLRSTLTPGGTR
jgi:uncharacterized membrane protein